MKKTLRHRLSAIKFLATDVDGVLTDGGMYYGEDGGEWKKFNTRDGLGLRLLQESGITVAIITSEKSAIVHNRAKKLRIGLVYQGVKDKLSVMDGIRSRYGLKWDEIAYIGDDLNDLALLQMAGFSASPRDAIKKISTEVHYRCKRNGGSGCVREVCDLLLSSRTTKSR